MPWTTWGRFAHHSPRAREEVHLPCVLESRSAGQRALAPPTDGRPTIGQLKHYTTISPTTAQPLSNPAPTIGNLNPSTTDLQPPHNRETITTTPQSFPNHIPAARSRQTDDPALGKHPRLQEPHDSETTILHHALKPSSSFLLVSSAHGWLTTHQ